jgi:23S rRNA pseudouridine1911/1915/1917 synthase
MDERRIRKVYLALASGTVRPEAFTIDAPIGPVLYPGMTTIHVYCPDGRPSVSRVRVIRRLPELDATLLEVTILAGRPHQIGIHLSHADFPLLGDPLYQAGGFPFESAGTDGRPALPGDGGYFLHSWKIGFPHLGRGEKVEVTSPPPPLLDPAGRA